MLSTVYTLSPIPESLILREVVDIGMLDFISAFGILLFAARDICLCAAELMREGFWHGKSQAHNGAPQSGDRGF